MNLATGSGESRNTLVVSVEETDRTKTSGLDTSSKALSPPADPTLILSMWSSGKVAPEAFSVPESAFPVREDPPPRLVELLPQRLRPGAAQEAPPPDAGRPPHAFASSISSRLISQRLLPLRFNVVSHTLRTPQRGRCSTLPCRSARSEGGRKRIGLLSRPLKRIRGAQSA